MDEILEETTFARIQSPSSINMYLQCPRKYYYRYIARLPTKPSIHLLRGSIVHKVLEDIYDVPVEQIPEGSFPVTLKVIMQEKFRQEWEAARLELARLNLTDFDLEQYYEETKIMINNFFHYLIEQLEAHPEGYASAFRELTPDREVEFSSRQHGVRGFVDAIHSSGESLFVLDYKTSSRAELSEGYLLQLSIYGLLLEEFERRPDEVGIFFLKHGREIRVPVTQEMIEKARREVHSIHARTQSKDIRDYPQNPGPLCKWSTGQCDFYEECFGQKRLDSYGEDLVHIGRK